MSNSEKPIADHKLERITAHSAEVGKGFVVRRAVPTKARRMVGAWCFLDHVGPADFDAGQGLNVGPHPHIGLQTFTWMIEGEILHRDSLGYEQIIRPGQVNLMTAGNGITHSEESITNAAGRLHITQLWIALPEAGRHREPDFKHYPDLPIIDTDGFHITLLVGSAFNFTAPPHVYSPMVGMDLKTDGAAKTRLQLNPDFEHAVLCLDGAIDVEGESIEPGTLLYLGLGRDTVSIGSDSAARLLLIGGEPFKENILMWWNFVARNADEMIRATEQWNTHQHFPEVKNSPLKRLIAPDPSGLHLKS
ncbi:MAG: pirin family protein [Arenimonas sp.]